MHYISGTSLTAHRPELYSEKKIVPFVRVTCSSSAAARFGQWAFDLNRLDVDGEPVPVIEGVEPSETGAKRHDVARDGTLIYLPRVSEPGGGRRIDWIDRDGVVTTLVEEVSASGARVAPDGNRIAVSLAGMRGGLWVFDIERQSRSLVISNNAGFVRWSPELFRRVRYRAEL